MKKLLALLLALVLPGMAAAESWKLSLSFDVDETLFTYYARQELQGNAEFASMNLDSLLSAIAQILDGFAMDVTVQEDAVQLNLYAGKGELLNMTLHAVGENLFLTTPMLSGYAIQADLPETFVATELQKRVEEIAASWLAQFSPTVLDGVFQGDAFEGGTQCSTWVLSDSDISSLLSSLATYEFRAIGTALLDVLNLDTASVIAAFDEANKRVSREDAYYYILRLISNDAEEPVGAALTVMREYEQVATISLAHTSKTIKIVMGLGLRNENYWWEFSGKTSQLRNVTFFSGTAKEWLADKSEAFSYVNATNAPLEEYMVHCTFTKSGNRYLWDGNVSIGDEVAYDYVYSSTGTWIPAENAVKCTFSMGDSPYELLRLNLEFGRVEAIALMEYSMKPVSATDPDDEAMYRELTSRFAASVLARLIKILPMDLLMTINQFALPD